MPPSAHRFLILADGQFDPLSSKTANSCIRYFPERIVAVLDRVQAGRTAQDVLGYGGPIPVVADLVDGVCVVGRRDGTPIEEAIERLRGEGMAVVGGLVVD